jgi:uncharacterized membrane protein YbhN (UPF0104 family)
MLRKWSTSLAVGVGTSPRSWTLPSPRQSTARSLRRRPGDPGPMAAAVPCPPDRSAPLRRLRAGLVAAGALSIIAAGLVLAVPDLREVGHRIGGAEKGWLALAAALEFTSVLGYVLAFQGVFDDLPRRFAALVAGAEQAFGAVVPVGGAGGIAAGGWLLFRRGMKVREIAERSGVLFLVTSATNVIALLVASAGLAIGLFAGPHDALRTLVPAAVAGAVLALFLGLARRARGAPAEPEGPGRLRLGAVAGVSAQTAQVIRRPGWRLGVGAPIYLLADVAVLWVSIRALGHSIPAAALLVAYLLGYLANTIPVPGGIGVLDGGLAAVLLAYQVPAATAVGGVLIYHALALWIPTVTGALAFIAARPGSSQRLPRGLGACTDP